MAELGIKKPVLDFLIKIILYQITHIQASAGLKFSFHQTGVCSENSVGNILFKLKNKK